MLKGATTAAAASLPCPTALLPLTLPAILLILLLLLLLLLFRALRLKQSNRIADQGASAIAAVLTPDCTIYLGGNTISQPTRERLLAGRAENLHL